jgi:hypothetical protein
VFFFCFLLALLLLLVLRLLGGGGGPSSNLSFSSPFLPGSAVRGFFRSIALGQRDRDQTSNKGLFFCFVCPIYRPID